MPPAKTQVTYCPPGPEDVHFDLHQFGVVSSMATSKSVVYSRFRAQELQLDSLANLLETLNVSLKSHFRRNMCHT